MNSFFSESAFLGENCLTYIFQVLPKVDSTSPNPCVKLFYYFLTLIVKNISCSFVQTIKIIHEILVYPFSAKKTKSKILLPNLQSRDEKLLQIEPTDHPRRAVGEKIC